MKKLFTSIIFFFTIAITAFSQNVYINEIHYDNVGGDTGEFIEIFITNPQPSDLENYTLRLYNGSNGTTYGIVNTFDEANEVVDNQTSNYGTGSYYVFNYASNGIQNGAPDGLSTDYNGTVIEFLSYEGSIEATNGPADGMISTDIGASESGSASIGTSIQNNGAGIWVAGLNTTSGATNINDLLPVELTKFSATKRSNRVNLNWQTASEINNDRFEIERSTDAVRYETIGAVKGNGNSLRLNDYTFVDETPLTGINYYRLKQIDIDGRFEYSDVVSVEIDRSNIRITPTSTYDFVTVSTGAESSIILRSVNGQVMNRQTNTEGNFTIEMANYAQGIYFLSIKINGSIQTEKVVRL